MRLGARMIKTGIGVVLAILISQWLPMIEPSLPAFTAAIGIQQTVRKSYQIVIDRVLGAILGGIVAVIMYTLFGNNALIIGLTVILFISILNALKLSNVITLSTVTLIIIMLNETNVIFYEAILRVIESIIGVLVSFLVNTFIWPPKYDRVLYEEINKTSSEVLIRLRAILRKNGEYSSLTQDLQWTDDQIQQINLYYNMLKEEQVWSKRQASVLKRKLVVFRAFIKALKEARSLLFVLHSNTNLVFSLPESLRRHIRGRVETLCAAHEQIFLKFDGRISPQQVNFFQSTTENRQRLIDEIFEEAKLDSTKSMVDIERSNGLLLMTGAIIRYEDALIHLNTLVRSYRTNHQADNYQTDSLESIHD